jgi:methyl-accepting chemotaxis protein
MEKKVLRKKYLIEKSLQTKFIMRFIAVSVVGTLAALIVFNYLAHKKITALQYSMKLPQISTSSFLVEEMIYAVLVSAIIIFIALVITSRGLVGKLNEPLAKLASSVKKIRAGDLSGTVQLRKDDDFQNFAGQLNTLSHELNKKFSAINNHINALKKLSDRKSTPDTNANLKKSVNDTLEKLEKELKSFKT